MIYHHTKKLHKIVLINEKRVKNEVLNFKNISYEIINKLN